MMKRLREWAGRADRAEVEKLREEVAELRKSYVEQLDAWAFLSRRIDCLKEGEGEQSAAIAKLHQEIHVLKRRDRKELKETARAEAKKAVRDVVESKADAMKGQLTAQIGSMAQAANRAATRNANDAVDKKFAAYNRTNTEWVRSIVGRLDEAEGNVKDIGGTLMRLLGGLQKAVAPDDDGEARR